MNGYLAAVQKVLDQFPSRRKVSPAQLLDQWAAFVSTAISGFPLGWYEFDDERRVRDVIQALRDNDAVMSFPEGKEWFGRVESIDDQYRRILVPVADAADKPWWKSGVPAYGGQEFVEDLRRLIGIEADLRE